MLAACSALLNHVVPLGPRGIEEDEFSPIELEFYPQLYYPLMDDWDFDARFTGRTIDHSDAEHIRDWLRGAASSCLPVAGRLVFQAGEFQSVYSGSAHGARFHAVVSSFFIDTAAESVLVYLKAIHHVLRPGGLWINAGPLHYHQATTTPYSHSYLQRIILSAGFDLLESRVIEADYCGETLATMKPEHYRVPLSVYRKQAAAPSVGGGLEESFASFADVAYLTQQLKALAGDWAAQHPKGDDMIIGHET